MRFFRISALVTVIVVHVAGGGTAVAKAPAKAAPSATPTPDPLENVADPGPVLPPPTLAAVLRALHGGQPENAARDLQRLRVAGSLESAAEGHFLTGRAWLAAG